MALLATPQIWPFGVSIMRSALRYSCLLLLPALAACEAGAPAQLPGDAPMAAPVVQAPYFADIEVIPASEAAPERDMVNGHVFNDLNRDGQRQDG